MSKAAGFEAESLSRDEEWKATGAALSQVSFLRLAGQSSAVNFQAVRFASRSGQHQCSPRLAQLASRMASAIRNNNRAGNDPFATIKGLVRDMIA